MAILTSSQQTFVDITDQRKLSAYITSNLPKTQSEDPNTLPHTYAPSWKTTNLTLTPVVFLDQTSVPLGSTGLTISWRRKDGVAAETNLITGESASGGILTVNKDVLADSDSGMITYICYISYYDSETKNTVNITSDITYTLVKNGETAKLAYVTADSYNMIDGRNNNRVAKKEEKNTDEKPSLLGRLKEKQEQLSSGVKKDAPAQNKKSERDMQ